MPKKEVFPKVDPPRSENLKLSIPAISKRAAILTKIATKTEIAKILKVEAEFGTLNLGFYPGAGGIVNSNGAIVGNESTGPEIMHLGIALRLNE